MKVLHLSSELSPIAKVGGLADAVAGMVKYSRRAGIDARVVLPEYGFLRGKFVGARHDAPVQGIGAMREIGGIRVYFVEHKKYFGKCQGVYGCFDDEREVLRFAWFCQQVVEMALADGFGKEGWQPEILHCHDWPAALAPMVLGHETKRNLARNQTKPSEKVERLRTVLTIHNFAYQGKAGVEGVKKVIGPIGLIGQIGPIGQTINFLAEGIKYADFINTVSPTHAKEILRGKMGDGLVGLLRKKKKRFVGILNGIEGDKFAKTYKTYKTYMTWKEKQKRRLQKEAGLAPDIEAPVFGFVGRLVKQKGVELLISAKKREKESQREKTRKGPPARSVVEEIVRKGGQVVILGEGYRSLKLKIKKTPRQGSVSFASQNEKLKIDRQYQGQFVFINRFDSRRADLIFKGADFLLVPSKFEPCGLVQMIAMQYGTLPIVHNVGGLKDTVRSGLTGFVFEEYCAEGLLSAVRRVMELYQREQSERGKMMEMRQAAMREDFSWNRAIREYKKIYKQISNF